MSTIVSINEPRKIIRVRLNETDGLDEYMEMIREVAVVTNPTGGYAIVIDGRHVRQIPSFTEIGSLAREVWRLRSPEPDDIAIIAVPEGVLYGKARQLVAVLTHAGLKADMFSSEAECEDWLAARIPGSRSADLSV